MPQKHYVVALLLLFLSSPILAADPPETGLYLGGAAGQSKLKEGHNLCDSIAGASAITDCKDTATGYRAFIGYKIIPFIGLEGAYYDTGKFKASGNVGGFGLAADAKAAIGEGLVLFNLPILPRWDIYAKGGMAHWHVKETGSAGSANASITDNGWSPTYGVGTNLWFTNNVGLQFEARRYKNIGEESTTGKSDVDFLSGGIIVRF